jgi:Ca2+/H+ antiporter
LHRRGIFNKPSLGISVLLIIAYRLGLLFSLGTHNELFASADHGVNGSFPSVRDCPRAAGDGSDRGRTPRITPPDR